MKLCSDIFWGSVVAYFGYDLWLMSWFPFLTQCPMTGSSDGWESVMGGGDIVVSNFLIFELAVSKRPRNLIIMVLDSLGVITNLGERQPRIF